MKKLVPYKRTRYVSLRSDGRVYIPHHLLPSKDHRFVTVEYNDEGRVVMTFHTQKVQDSLEVREDRSGNLVALGRVCHDIGIEPLPRRLRFIEGEDVLEIFIK